MDEINKNELAGIRIRFSGKDLELMLQAWEKYPLLKKDCNLTKAFKEKARNAYFEKLKKAA